jgi:PPOX class probable F420-dependent enzyme
MKGVPPYLRDLLADETRSIAFLATLMPDGSPQLTPVWFNTAGEYLLINSAKGRVKDRNMRARPQVAVSIMAMDDMYRYIQLRGKVVEIDEESGADHIHALSQKYRGRMYDIPEGELRVMYRIELDEVSGKNV